MAKRKTEEHSLNTRENVGAENARRVYKNTNEGKTVGRSKINFYKLPFNCVFTINECPELFIIYISHITLSFST